MDKAQCRAPAEMLMSPRGFFHNELVGTFHTQQYSQKHFLLHVLHSTVRLLGGGGSKLNLATENAALPSVPGLSATGSLLHLPMSLQPLGMAGSLL